MPFFFHSNLYRFQVSAFVLLCPIRQKALAPFFVLFFKEAVPVLGNVLKDAA